MMMMMTAPYKAFAGIGSRETPVHVLEQMRALSMVLAGEGWVLRTGGADGADSAFEEAYKDYGGTIELFLPWKGFNFRSKGFLPSEKAYKLAEEYHPNWAACSNGAKSLHARNVHQVLGATLNDPVDFVICWTKDGSPTGGTGQAMRIAADKHIPIYNLYNMGPDSILKAILKGRDDDDHTDTDD